MSAFQSWLNQLEYEKLLRLLLTVVAALVCITLHEVSHGYAALRLGDPTAKNAGRLSLNPIRHMDWVGLLSMALLGFGWAKPVPIDPRNFKHFRRDTALTALAGPVSNVLIAAVALTCYSGLAGLAYDPGQSWWAWYLAQFFLYTATLSANLAVFNLIPVPPLDGSKVLFALLPSKSYAWLLQYERYGFFLMAVLLFLGVLNGPLAFLRQGLLNLLWPVCSWPLKLLAHV